MAQEHRATEELRLRTLRCLATGVRLRPASKAQLRVQLRLATLRLLPKYAAKADLSDEARLDVVRLSFFVPPDAQRIAGANVG